MSPTFVANVEFRSAIAVAKRRLRVWMEKRALPLSRCDAQRMLEDVDLPLEKWCMLTVCWVTASRYADVKRMADIDITKFVANHRRLIRWRVRTLKSNKCGLTKWIPSGGRLKKLVDFLWTRAKGTPSDSEETTRRANSHSDLCSESSSLHPSSAQGHTKRCLHSSQHQERCGDNVSFSRNKDVLHSTAPWTCGHPNNANVRRSTSDSIRVKEENHTRTPPGTDSGVRHVFDSPSCSTRDFFVAKVQQKQSQSCTVTNAQKSVEWDVRLVREIL